MIPRAARRLETTLLSSRQALPRPARLYSTPSKVRSAPATATAPAVSPQPDFPFPTSKQPELSSFLSRPLSVTLIPSPEPLDTQRNALDPWFIDSQSYEIVGIIDACLHNFHDIPRAQAMLERIRSRVGSPALSTRLYNSFIIAYTQLATKEPEKKGVWLTQASKIYYILQDEVDGVLPNTKTFALMFDMLKQHGESDRVTTKEILSHAVKRGIPVTEIVTNPYFSEPERSMEISQMLSSAAFNLGFKDVLKDLGHFNAVARGNEVLDDVPDAMPVQSKRIVNGEEEKYTPLKIESLRASLNDVIEAKAVFENNNNARQEHLEASAYDLALKQLEARNKDYASNVPRDPDLQYWIWTWHSGLEKRLKDLIKSAKLNVAEGRARVSRTAPQESVEARQQWTMINDIMPCLTAVSPERLSLMTILELIRMQGVGTVQNGMKTTAALVAIGKNVEREYKSEICRQSGIPVPDYEITRGNYFSEMGYKFLHQRRLAAARSQDLDEQWQGDWSQAMRSKIGAFLVNTLESVAKVRREKVNPNTGEVITEDQPAIYNAYEFVRGHKLGVLKFNEVVSERIAKDSLISTVHARHLPMLVKPKPWVGYRQGGYIYNKCVAMRFKECAEQEAYLQKATEDGKMEHIYAGLDVLGSTPWQINKDIFKIVLEVWNSGKRVGKIPPATYDVPEPVLEEGKERDIQAKAHYITRHRVWSHGSSNNHSDRCSVNYKIEIARAFLGDTIYMPHNLDFRGRAYPIPPHLNHIGDDLSRSLLKFAEGKPLGVRGLHWLKIHAANLYGYDKANFDERVEWAEERLEQIKESAKNPLEGTRWWLSAGDPWQFLACCMELTKAMELEDPTTYVCTLPVHQDGTCNGLQHYAALGGDIRGAQQVNLLASDRPSDVYTHISQHVEADMDKEAEAGNELAKMLKGKITRKVVKQTVMTTVYGVTFVGAREQIERQLRDRGDIPAEMCWGASSYLAKKVLGTIGDAFTGAKAIQDWLNLCARLITKSVPEEKLIESQNRNTTSMADVKKMQMTSVIWTTKLGLPIVQPYRKVVRKQIRTSMQSLFISDPRVLSEVNSIKQASAFPPNFVHSLDATHMMLTALKCREHGLTFASVHDSYWTHACDIDEMSEIIRDTFISLHSSGILSALEKEFRDRYKNHYIALTHIFGQNGTRFAQKLRAAGTRIYAHPDQALELQSIKDLVIFTDDKSSIAVVNGVDTTLSEGENGESVGAYSSLLDGKFVRLSDLMPPLPKRGDLNVEDIKNSPYFFS